MENYVDPIEARMVPKPVETSSNGIWVDRDNRGFPLSIIEQIDNLNAVIFKELEICRELCINPNQSKKYKEIIAKGKRVYGRWGYEFTGIIFQKAKRKRVKKTRYYMHR